MLSYMTNNTSAQKMLVRYKVHIVRENSCIAFDKSSYIIYLHKTSVSKKKCHDYM